MTRAQIRSTIENQLLKHGFGRRDWSWDGPLLTVLVNERPMRMKMTTATPKYILLSHLGRIAGWGDMLEVCATTQPRKLNGVATRDGETEHAHA